MIGRRPLLALLACALLIGVGAWWFVQGSPSPAPELSSAPVTISNPSGLRANAESPGGEPAQPSDLEREASESASSAANEPIDDFLPDGLREALPASVARGRAHGRVVDRAGEPVAGARVLGSLPKSHPNAALDAQINQGQVREATTDSAGRFELLQLLPGPLRVAVRAKGFAPLDPRATDLPPSGSVDLGELRLERGASLRGRVIDPDRRPVAQARISLVSAPLLGPVSRLGELAATPLGTSGADGRFELASIPNGSWTLLVCHPEFPDGFFEGESEPLSPDEGELELVLSPATYLTGSIAEYDERASPGLSVIAVPAEGLELFQHSKPEGASSAWLAGVRTAPVDRVGRFEITGLAPGKLVAVRATRANASPGEQGIDRPDPWAPVQIVATGSEDVELTYLPGARLDFEVAERASGEPIERLRVRLTGVWPSEPLDAQGKPMTFFAQGRVSLVDLRAEAELGEEQVAWGQSPSACEVALVVEAPGYDTVRLDKLSLEPGARQLLGTVQLYRLPVLDVRVVEADSLAPINGARVELAADSPGTSSGRTRSAATTARNGFARLTSLSVSPASLFVSCPGFAPARVPAPSNLASGAPPVVVPLSRGARVAVTVIDERSELVPAANVFLTREAPPEELAWTRQAPTDAQGVAQFVDVPAGVYSLSAERRDTLGGMGRSGARGKSAASWVVELGDDLHVEVQVPAISALWGSVWLGRDPLANAQLCFQRGGSGFRDLGSDMQSFTSAMRVRTDVGGEFPRVELAPGEYTVLIEHAGLGVLTRRVVRVEMQPTEVIIDVDDTAIRGRVSDAQGQPVAGVSVRLYADRAGLREDLRPLPGEYLLPLTEFRRPIRETTTEADGSYRLGAVPPGMPLQMLFSLGQRASAIPRIHAPSGRTMENIDARLPEAGSLEIVLSAPLAPPGLHYGVRIVGLKQPEGLGVEGRHFDGEHRARFDELAPGPWRVMVFTLNASDQIVEQREPQSVQIKAGLVTEFSVGW